MPNLKPYLAKKNKGFFLTVSITIIYRNINQGILFNVTPSY